MLFVRNVIQQYPEVYEDEIRQWLQYARGKTVSVASISRYIKKMGLTRRKVGTFQFLICFRLSGFYSDTSCGEGEIVTTGFTLCIPYSLILLLKNVMNKAGQCIVAESLDFAVSS